ncbi:MAG TPA: corrinoid protein [Spirochaetia bacterium]|nr:corrinoid protein [Spirochaetia bacterium]
MASMQEISELLQKGRAKEVAALVQEALDSGATARSILEEGLMAGMNIIGVKFKNNEVYVPEVLIAARAMNAGIEVLKPVLKGEDRPKVGTVVIGTVKGDLHDIGKNLVKIMMEGKGLEVHDLGSDVTPQRFVEKAKEVDARIIACSALLTTTMTSMKEIVSAVEAAGLRDRVSVMIGGAPVTQSYCESIGADFYAPDATSAAEVAIQACAGAA